MNSKVILALNINIINVYPASSDIIRKKAPPNATNASRSKWTP